MKEGSKVTIKDGSYMMTTKKGKISHIGAFDSTNTIGWNKETWTILCTGGVYPKDTNRTTLINDIMIVNDVNGEVWFCSDINIKEVEQKPKFKVGQWAITAYKKVFRILSMEDGWVIWINELGESVHSNPDYLNSATEDEIETHLIAEAGRRGFKDGVIRDYPKLRLVNPSRIHFPLCYNNDRLVANNSIVIWDETDGWASIVPEKKKLPKTKGECIKFITDWMDSAIHDEKDFLKDYED